MVSIVVDQRVALGAEPVDGLLGLPDQVDEPGRVAAPDLGAAGDAVGGRQQQPGAQADQRHAEAPRRTGMRGLVRFAAALGLRPCVGSRRRATLGSGCNPLHRRTV